MTDWKVMGMKESKPLAARIFGATLLLLPEKGMGLCLGGDPTAFDWAIGLAPDGGC